MTPHKSHYIQGRDVKCPKCHASRRVSFRPGPHNFRCRTCDIVFTRAEAEGAEQNLHYQMRTLDTKILTMLAIRRATVNELATAFGMEWRNMNTQINRLVKVGKVQKSLDRNDGRRIIYSVPHMVANAEIERATL
jgi:phage FluMu protein Com